MYTKWLPALVFGLSMGLIGCGSSSPTTPSGSGGATATGGNGSGGSSTGGSGTGGKGSGGVTATGGTASGGHASGGSATGGTASGGSATGGTATGGTASGGAAGGSTGGGGKAAGGSAAGGKATGGGTAMGGSTGTGGGGGSGSGSAPKPSAGCGVMDGAKKITMGGTSVSLNGVKGLPTSTKVKIMSGGMNREFIIDIPANYDATHPYRLIFSWYQAYGSDDGNATGLHPANDGPNFNTMDYAFFGLRREADAANTPVIFVAPGGSGNLPWDFTRDAPFFDDLLALVDANLCVDDSRVFTTGFSFGAMMSYALSVTRQTKLRAAVVMSGVQYALPGEPKDSNAAPIAYMGTNGLGDTTCPWDNGSNQGGKYCALTHAMENGCTIPSGNNIPTTTMGSKKFVCYDFTGCKAGYPVKACTFDGPHTPSIVDDGSNTGDDGLKAFIPPLAWQFISQF